MSAKPETTFIGSIHKKFGSNKPYFEKTNNPWRAGMPDVYYSGVVGCLWVEYKFISRIPRSSAILPNLSMQQHRWLADRFAEGRNVAVVLGTPKGGIVYRDMEWCKPLSGDALAARLLPREDIAGWILSEVGTSLCHSSIPYST